jgi:large subunit ribosomal protein L13
MKTYLAKQEDVKRNWFVVDARDKVLGRLASGVASVLRGKHKTSFTPHIDCGDGVIVVNAKNIRVTGKKMEEKLYKTYSGYPSGLKQRKMSRMMKDKPTRIIRIAVKNMLPKNKIGRQMIKRLKVYADDKHPHVSQGPKELKIG